MSQAWLSWLSWLSVSDLLWKFTMPHRRHRRRVIFPMWLKYLVRSWRQEGLTLIQIKARLAELGVRNVKSATIAAWFGEWFRDRKPAPQ